MRHFLLLAAFLIAPQAARAAPVTATVTVTGAWSRATAGPAMPGALFATFGGGATAEALVAVTTQAAQRAVLHHMDMGGGMMRMAIAPALAIPAGGTLVLTPDGDHVMLMGLTGNGLVRGATYPATFRFRHAPPVTVMVRVAGPGAAGP